MGSKYSGYAHRFHGRDRSAPVVQRHRPIGSERFDAYPMANSSTHRQFTIGIINPNFCGTRFELASNDWVTLFILFPAAWTRVEDLQSTGNMIYHDGSYEQAWKSVPLSDGIPP